MDEKKPSSLDYISINSYLDDWLLAPPDVSSEIGRFCEPFESFVASDCDDWSDDVCGFFDAGPLFTPGFSPVWVFGEFDPLPLELELDECV